MATELLSIVILFVPVAVLGFYLSLQSRNVKEWERKGVHVITALVLAIAVLKYSGWASFTLGFLVFLALTAYVFLERMKGISNSRQWGYILFGLGFILSHILFLNLEPIAVAYGILILGFSDAGAALAGKRWGNGELFGKSWVGSMTFFKITTIISLIMGVPLLSALVVSLILSVIELFAKKGTDNVLLPIVAGALYIFFV